MLVIGAGISGCLASLASAEAGHSVTLLESASAPGGILRDHELKQGRWFRNCQYLDVGSPWTDLVLSLPGLDHQVFEHRYGSWNDLFGQVVVHSDFAQVVIPSLRAKPIQGHPDFESAADRLSRYPTSVGSTLLQWAAKWGDLRVLDHKNCEMMQVSRVFFSDDPAGVIACKGGNSISEDLYGVPRSLRQPPVTKQMAALPTGGWNTAFEKISEALTARGVDIRLRSRAQTTFKGGKVRIESHLEKLDADIVVWCANPNPLVRALGMERLDSPVTQMVNLLCEIEGSPPDEPIYWHIFSQQLPIVRLFHYDLGGKARMTVEAFASELNAEQLATQATQISRDLGMHISLRPVGLVPERRHVLVTLRDREQFAELEALADQAAVVTGGWQEFGRDQRLAHIFESMGNKGAL